MHVEYVEKNAESGLFLAANRDRSNVGDLAIPGRDDRTGILRNGTLGVAKEPQKEAGQQNRDDCPHGARQPAEQDGGGEQGGSIQISVTDHGNIQL